MNIINISLTGKKCNKVSVTKLYFQNISLILIYLFKLSYKKWAVFHVLTCVQGENKPLCEELVRGQS